MGHPNWADDWTVNCPKCGELAFSDKAKNLPTCSNCNGELGVWFQQVSGEMRGTFACKGCGERFAQVTHKCGCNINASGVKYSKLDHATSCFVATATMGDINHPVVVDLRLFRDDYLVKYKTGRLFIDLYWKIGPTLAKYIEQYPLLKMPSYYFIVKPASVIANMLKK